MTRSRARSRAIGSEREVEGNLGVMIIYHINSSGKAIARRVLALFDSRLAR
jgi:hypothetical protein